MKRITVLTGGSTPERHVALAGAAQVVRALRGLGHVVTIVDTVDGPLDEASERAMLESSVGRDPPTLEELSHLAARERPELLPTLPELRETELVFLVLHGQQGEGGEIQALLDLTGIPYTGSGPLGSAVAMDKDVAKRLLTAAGVPTPEWQMWPLAEWEESQLEFPVIVKPSKVGSSVGLSVVRAEADLVAAVELAERYDREVMLERYIDGREFTVGVLNEKALAVGEIIPQHETFDYECKYTPGMTEEVFPAVISDELAVQLRDLAERTHRALKLREFSRVDFRVDQTGTPWVLEANTLPGLTGTSLLPQSAAACGIDFAALCDTICSGALQRAREQTGPPKQ
ncbi:MAG: D-alanine--D-alanine ligase [Gemmatimonadota bacterium]|nr:MAG: D-alanine--D-alanine ligase [Gemmatimonadota bacterium]